MPFRKKVTCIFEWGQKKRSYVFFGKYISLCARDAIYLAIVFTFCRQCDIVSYAGKNVECDK